ncbi:MAG: YolD-like family protein [Lachnospiraceae bacterium]|nr:YolD-like family protein [Lachnospiraceae bacterium]
MANNIHPKMDRASRAKQFMPFDALKGFREALAEKERALVPKKEFSQEWQAELDDKLRHIHKLDIVTAEYFQNGEYGQVTGEVSKIDIVGRVLKIAGMGIPFDDISDLHSGN